MMPDLILVDRAAYVLGCLFVWIGGVGLGAGFVWWLLTPTQDRIDP
jgi:hypothetical protein